MPILAPSERPGLGNCSRSFNVIVGTLDVEDVTPVVVANELEVVFDELVLGRSED